MRRLITLALVATSAVALTGCAGDAVNTNVRTNGNTAANNTIVVANANKTNTVSTTNTNRWNANISKEEYEKDKANYERDKGESTIGTGINDSWLWFKTRSALATTADLRESTINVDVVNGVITLKGTVATAEQKKKAVEVANGIDGKTGSVKDELKVAPKDSITNTGSMTDSDKKANTSANVNKK